MPAARSMIERGEPTMEVGMSDVEGLQAQLMAHRALLAYLVKAVRMLPGEGTQEAVDKTATMLHNSMDLLYAGLPEPHRSRGATLAQQEIDRIMTALFQDAPPPSGQTPGTR